jgi:hypothetical protein
MLSESNTTDWKQIALALEPPIPADDVDKVVPVLEALERAFAPLRSSIPAGADLWTGPEDVA